MKTIYYGVLMALGLSFACSQKPAPAEEKGPVETPAPIETLETPAATAPEAIALDSFSEFPEEMRGCSCYFSRNKEEFKASHYIFLSNYTSAAIVSIGGQQVKLLRKGQNDSVKTDTPYQDTTGKYEVRAIVRKSSSTGEEVSWTEGVLQVKDLKTGAASEIPFVGECGC